MAYSHYDRLSASDLSMLMLDGANTPMQVGAVALFEAAPLQTPEGTLDFARIRAAVEATLPAAPRFRQKIMEVPYLGHPVWVDDASFNLDYHVRHTALPAPGSVRQLKRLAGRLMSQRIDASKPLWELWVIEGVEEGRFALAVKAHHCMVDGVGGIDLLVRLMRGDPDPSIEPPRSWIPRPAPTPGRLLRDEIGLRASVPLRAFGAARRALAEPRRFVSGVREGLGGLRAFAAGARRPEPSATPFEADVGPYRRVDWTRVDFEAAREIKAALGGTVNDVVLACVAGAVGTFLAQRGLSPQDLDIRAAVPVNLRRADQSGELGNHVSTLMAELPVGEADPRRRLAKVVETMRELKRSSRQGGWGALTELSDDLFPSLLGYLVRAMAYRRVVNLYVSNIPGPRIPVYLVGARMLEIYPVAPIALGGALSVALFSYAGGICFGFNSDWDGFPDLHEMAQAIDLEFETLRKVAAAGPAAPSG